MQHRAVKFNLDGATSYQSFAQGWDWIFKTFPLFLSLWSAFQRRGERRVGQRAGRRWKLALTCFPKHFHKSSVSLSAKLVISPPPSKPSQPFWLPAPTPTLTRHTPHPLSWNLLPRSKYFNDIKVGQEMWCGTIDELYLSIQAYEGKGGVYVVMYTWRAANNVHMCYEYKWWV